MTGIFWFQVRNNQAKVLSKMEYLLISDAKTFGSTVTAMASILRVDVSGFLNYKTYAECRHLHDTNSRLQLLGRV